MIALQYRDWLFAAGLAPLELALAAQHLPPERQLPALCCATLSNALALHDARTGYLPDTGTLGLLWLGLLCSEHLHNALYGAVLGYSLPWLLGHGYRVLRGRHGMGYGDYKFLAAAGAWVGVDKLSWVILIACGSALAYCVFSGLQKNQRIAFGPHIAIGLQAVLFAFVASG